MNSLESIVSAIRQGKLKKSLELLSDFVQQNQVDDSDIRNAVINLSARYHQLQRRRLSSLISEGEAQITENQIRYSTLEVVDIIRDQMAPETIDFPQPRNVFESIEKFRNLQTEDVKPIEPGEDPGDERKQILFMASSPVILSGRDENRQGQEINLSFFDEEIVAINKVIDRRQTQNRLFLNVRTAVKANDVGDLLLGHKPFFVHFSGHGRPEGLVFQDKSKAPHLVPKERLQKIFRHFTHKVKCVILNACFSRFQAEEIGKWVEYVIGTTGALTAGEAVTFAKSFYYAYGIEESVEFAFEYAKDQTELSDLSADPNNEIILFEKGEIYRPS